MDLKLGLTNTDTQRSFASPASQWVERINRTIKEVMVKRYYYETHSQLETYISDFIAAYNYARRLKTLQGLTPFEYVCKIWTIEPERFTFDPTYFTLGLNTSYSTTGRGAAK